MSARVLLAGAVLPLALLAPGGPRPERGVAVVFEPVDGRVLVRPDGVREYRPLRAAERLPVGTTVDAKEGSVRLIVARDDSGGTWRAVFSEGKFTVSQPRRGEPITTLKLTGATFHEVCGDAATASRRKRRVRRLWGDGHGRFRTAGHYSAATVRGTRWLTEDRCDGTLTRVVRGSVEVQDFTAPAPAPGPEPPTVGTPQPAEGGEDGAIVVASGDSYLARPGS